MMRLRRIMPLLVFVAMVAAGQLLRLPPASAAAAQFAGWILPPHGAIVDNEPVVLVVASNGTLDVSERGTISLQRLQISANGTPSNARSVTYAIADKMIAGPDGYLWAGVPTTAGFDNLLRINPAFTPVNTAVGVQYWGSSTTVPIPGWSVISDASGPDGNVWSTLFRQGAAIGKTVPSTGKTIVYRMPSTVQSVSDITVGSDGAMYFTFESTATYQGGSALRLGVGRITTSGAVTLFVAPDDPLHQLSLSQYLQYVSNIAFMGPLNIATGLDGNAYVGLYNGVERVTPSGAFTHFPTLRRAEVQAPTLGPDGAVWFLEDGYDGNSNGVGLGRIAPSGAMTDIALTTAIPTPFVDLTVGPDKRLWFTEFAANKVVSFDPTGVLAMTTVPSAVPSGEVGQSYTATLPESATGGVAPYTWSVKGLPQGLTFDATTGTITGNPSRSGTFLVTEMVTDSETATPETSYYTLPLVIAAQAPLPRLQLVTMSLPDATVGQPYSFTLQATGGVSPYLWPALGLDGTGLSLNVHTGEITGTPTHSGTITIELQVDDQVPNEYVDATLSLVAKVSAPEITSFSASAQQLVASGGTVHLTWSAQNASTCTVTGAPGGALFPDCGAGGTSITLPANTTTSPVVYSLALTAAGGGTSVSKGVTVIVAAPVGSVSTGWAEVGSPAGCTFSCSGAPPARYDQSMAYDFATGQVVVFGGSLLSGGSQMAGDTWTWNGTKWTQSTATGPSPRYGATMIFDPRTRTLLLFGGANASNQFFNDTWEWTGSTWQQLHPTKAPSARYNATMAYDPSTGQVVLFGGYINTTGFLDDTWVWDGTNWTQPSPTHFPPAQMAAGMGSGGDYASTEGSVILLSKGASGAIPSTWLWTGSDWQQQAAATPPVGGGLGQTVAYDPALSEDVAYDANGDLWGWSGTAWHELATGGPAARGAAAMVYDTAVNGLVLFGGAGPSEVPIYNDTWTWQGSGSTAGPTTPPASEAVAASPSTVAADGSSLATVTATVYDQSHAPVSGVTVSFGTTLGSFGGSAEVTTNGNGVASTTLHSGTVGVAAVTAAVQGITTGNTVSVTFVPGPVQHIVLSTSLAVLPGGSVRVRGTVTDALGHPVPGAIVHLTASAGTIPAEATAGTDGALTVTFTAGSASGTVQLVATVGSISGATTIAVQESPVLASVAPVGGPVGSLVTIDGSGFGSSPGTVLFASNAGQGEGTVQTWGDTAVTVTVPSGLAAGTFTVTVQSAVGLPSNGKPFLVVPALGSGDHLAWSPSPVATSLAAGQDQTVILTATGSEGAPRPYVAIDVSFHAVAGGGTAAVGGTSLTATPRVFTADGNGQITVLYTAPATLPNVGADTLTAQNAPSSPAVSASDTYTFVPPPTLQSITPAIGPVTGGTTVVLSGSGLNGVTGVSFGGVAAQFQIQASGAVTAVVPATSTAGPVPVTVTSTEGTSGAQSFGYQPVLARIQGMVGPGTGGTSVDIFGQGFAAGSSVLFGTAPATGVIVVSPSQITAVSPAGSGTVPVSVVSAGETSVPGASAVTFSYLPRVAALSPDFTGNLAGGTQVTVSGVNLTGATAVDFGTTPGTGLTVVSDTEIQVMAPAGSGTVPVTVTTPGGTSAAVPFVYTSPGTISGSVTLAAGGPAVGAMVTVCALGSDGTVQTPCALETTDSTGAYQVQEPMGRYQVMANPPTGVSGLNATPVQVGLASSAVTAATLVVGAAVPPMPSNITFQTAVSSSGSGIYGAWPTTVQFTSCPAGTGTWRVATLSGDLEPLGGGVYLGTIPSLSQALGWQAYFENLTLDVTLYCPGQVAATTSVPLYIDPSGSVQTPAGAPIVGATVTLTQGNSAAGPFTAVPNGSAVMSPDNRQNPVQTGNDGVFAWNVVPGYYQITAQKSGCTVPGSAATVATSPILDIPPPADGLVLTLDCPGAALLPTTTNLTVSPTSTPVGQPVLLMAQVTSGADLAPTGLVSFLDGATLLGQAPVNASGQAELALNGLAAGSHLLTASYGGDGVLAGSNSVPGTLSVTADPVPTVSGVAPDAGSAAGDSWVTVTGTGFVVGGTTVDFGAGNPASAAVVDPSGTSIQVLVPSGSGGTTVDVTVITAGGTSATSALDRYTYAAVAQPVVNVPSPPIVNGIDPAVGLASGGETVTIRGSGLAGETGVRFGKGAARSVTPISDQEIIAVAPAGPAGTTVDVTVSTPGGTSVTSAADRFTFVAPASFSDVPAGYWAAVPIAQLSADGVIGGFPDGTFQPDATVTRAQFVKMLVLVLGLRIGSGMNGFADVSPSAWYAPYIAAATQAGIVQGTSATTFGPDAPLNREDMAVLLSRALKLTGSGSLGFTDSQRIDPWAQASVAQAVAAGYLSGFPDGSFQPQGPLTRAQAAKVLALVPAPQGR